MVKLENELKEPVKVRDTYSRGSVPDYSEWVEVKKNPWKVCFTNENVQQLALNHLPRRPGTITCPNCLNSVKPRSRRRFLPATHYTALALTPFLLFWVPYLLPCFQGKIHTCPYCKTCLGISGICEPSEPPKSSWYIINDEKKDNETSSTRNNVSDNNENYCTENIDDNKNNCS
uniref:CSON002339 protein n=1 Tax=Culicoides sonorensis TaxID=179676 RepID=A0A336L2N1_CULSO